MSHESPLLDQNLESSKENLNEDKFNVYPMTKVFLDMFNLNDFVYGSRRNYWIGINKNKFK